MRRIVYLQMGSSLDHREKCLEICSHYTPLVEPLENGAVYLDLSGCGDAMSILGEIGLRLQDDLREQLKAGLAASRLLARLAVQNRDINLCPASCFRVFSRSGIIIIEVLPGREKDFLSPLPLDFFYPLSPRAGKKLSRLGFTTVGQLAGLSPAQLGQFLEQGNHGLHLQLNGVDSSPVSGLYPPSRIVYPLDIGEENYNVMRQIEENAVRELASLLEERHMGCQRVSLQICSEKNKIIKERHLNSPCQEARQLAHILQGLFKPLLDHIPDAREIVITLDELAPLRLCQPDLFINRLSYEKREREKKREILFQDLQNRFPSSLRQGLSIDRREQILTLWDPWRYPPLRSCQ